MKRLINQSMKTLLKLNQFEQPYSIFCFVYDKNKLISIGRNNMIEQNAKAYRFGVKYGIDKLKDFPYMHAEMDSISKLWGRHYITGKEKFVVIRLKKNGELGMAKPCSNCQTVLRALNINNVIYSTDTGFEEYV